MWLVICLSTSKLKGQPSLKLRYSNIAKVIGFTAMQGWMAAPFLWEAILPPIPTFPISPPNTSQSHSLQPHLCPRVFWSIRFSQSWQSKLSKAWWLQGLSNLHAGFRPEQHPFLDVVLQQNDNALLVAPAQSIWEMFGPRMAIPNHEHRQDMTQWHNNDNTVMIMRGVHLQHWPCFHCLLSQHQKVQGRCGVSRLALRAPSSQPVWGELAGYPQPIGSWMDFYRKFAAPVMRGASKPVRSKSSETTRVGAQPSTLPSLHPSVVVVVVVVVVGGGGGGGGDVKYFGRSDSVNLGSPSCQKHGGSRDWACSMLVSGRSSIHSLM